MLSDFVLVKEHLATQTDIFLSTLIDEYMGPLKIIPKRDIVEGETLAHYVDEGPSKSVTFKNAEESRQIDIDKIKENPLHFWIEISELAKGMALQRITLIFEFLESATREVGTHQQITEVTPQVVLDMWRKIDIHFDGAGNPDLPGIISFNDKTNQEFAASVAKIDTDPELQKKFREIIAIKKQIWDDRESHRKLVD